MTSLERSLRVPLLARSRRGTTLTPTGRVVVDWASTFLGAAEDFERSVGTLRDSRAAGVRAAVSMTIADHYAPAWLARLHGRASEVVVSLVVHNSAKVYEMVESGQADLGFVESPTVGSNVRRRKIGSDRLIVAVPGRHPWARRRSVSAEELAAVRLLVREPGSGTRETLEMALLRRGLELVPGPVMGSNTAIRAAAVAGMGPVVLSELALASELSNGQLEEIDVPDLMLRRPISAIWRRSEELSAGAAALLGVAAERPYS